MNAHAKSGATQLTARALVALGYRTVLPVVPPGARLSGRTTLDPKSRGKAPGVLRTDLTWAGLGGWQSPDWAPTETEVDAWSTWPCNLGLAMGYQVAMLDVDVLDEGLAQAMRSKLEELVPGFFVRVGRAPKWAALFRVDGEPVPSSRITLHRETGDLHLVEILGTGKQAVVHGIHPGTGKPYQWTGGTMPSLERLPSITAAKLAELREKLLEVAEALGCERGTMQMSGLEKNKGSKLGAKSGCPELTASLLARLPNSGKEYDWDGWFRMCLAAAASELGERGLPAFHEFSSKHPRYDADATEAMWAKCIDYADGSLGAGTIHDAAMRAGVIGSEETRMLGEAAGRIADDIRARELADEVAEVAGSLSPQQLASLQASFGTSNDDLSANLPARHASKQAGPEEPSPDEPAGSAQDDPSTDIDPFDPGGLVSALADFQEARSEREMRLSAFAGALSAVSLLARNRWVVKRGVKATPLNLQTLLLAGSGVGKEDSRDLIKRVVAVAGDGLRVSPTYGSASALHQAFVRNPAQMWLSDEYGQWVKAAQASPSSHDAQLIRLAMEIHTSALSYVDEKEYSDTKKNKPRVNGPYLVALFTSTPEAFLDALNKQIVVNGMLGRQLVLWERGRPRLRDEGEKAAAPERFGTHTVEAIRRISLAIDRAPKNGSYQTDGGVKARTIRLTDDAEKLAAQKRIAFDTLAGQAPSTLVPIVMRGFEMVLRVAGVMALGQAAMKGDDALECPVLDKHTLECALALVRWSWQTAFDDLLVSAADNPAEKVEKAIVAAVRKLADAEGWAKQTDVVRNVKGDGRGYAFVKSQLEGLEAKGVVEYAMRRTEAGQLERSSPYRIKLTGVPLQHDAPMLGGLSVPTPGKPWSERAAQAAERWGDTTPAPLPARPDDVHTQAVQELQQRLLGGSTGGASSASLAGIAASRAVNPADYADRRVDLDDNDDNDKEPVE